MLRILLGCCLLLLPALSQAASITFGDMDCLGTNCYNGADPTAGAVLEGLAPGDVSYASLAYAHTFPFTPGPGDFPGTDQMWTGSNASAALDGYATGPHLNGPAVFVLDFSSLLSPGQTLLTLTLGIAADDFQFPVFGQPFTASINGSTNAGLTDQLNLLTQGGPQVQYFSFGLNPAVDNGSHTITLSIDELGNGGDGFAIDYLTVGVTAAGTPTPEPGTLLAVGAALVLLGVRIRRHRA